MLTLNDGRNELWQWDTNRNMTVDVECSQVHFSNKVFGRSIDVDVVDGVASIPDILLQTDKELTAWAFVGTPENGYTKISRIFKVNRRNKPADYVFTPTDQTTLDEVVERLDRIEESQGQDAIKNAVNEYLENNPIHVEETDPTVHAWAKAATKPTYTAQEVGALPADTKIPEPYVLPSATTDTIGGVMLDTTLTVYGKAADAGETGRWLNRLQTETDAKPTDTEVEMAIFTAVNAIPRPDWNENNPYANTYINSRTHWVEGGKTNILEWDGDTTDLESFADGDYTVYRVTDSVVSAADLVGGSFTFTGMGSMVNIPITSDMAGPVDLAGVVVDVVSHNETPILLSVTADISVDGVSLPRGIYLLWSYDGYVSKLTAANAVFGTGEGETVHKLDPKYIPPATAETVGGVKVGDGLTVDGDGVLRVAPKGIYELLEEITVGEGGASSVLFSNTPDVVALMACITAPAVPAESAYSTFGCYLNARYGQHSYDFVVGFNIGSKDGVYSARFEIKVDGGMLGGSAQGNVHGWGSGGLKGVNNAGNAILANRFVPYQVYCSNSDRTIPEGTNIKLYGVRA